MRTPWWWAGCLALMSGAAWADITLYQDANFQGRAQSSSGEVSDLRDIGFNDRASSIMVRGGRWLACSDAHFQGQCVSLAPGGYPSLSEMGLNDRISSVRPENSGWGGGAWQGGGEHAIDLYEHDNFRGRSLDASQGVSDLNQANFNDRVSSVIIRRGQWLLCSDADSRGRCITLGPGQYPELSRWNLNDTLSSVRQVSGGWNQGPPAPQADILLYENASYQGRALDASAGISDLTPTGFNDRVSSVVIQRGQWELCSDADFRGQCITLGPGQYPDLRTWHLNDQLSSVRPVRRRGFWGD